MRKTAANVEMQGIEFQIINDSSGAANGLERLKKSLNSLKTATSGVTASLSKTAQSIRELSNSLKQLNSGDASQKINRLVTALSSLGSLRDFRATVNSLAKLNTSLSNLSWTDGDKLSALADGLRPLSELGTSHLNSFINQLGKMPKVIEDLEDADVGKFTEQMKDLATAIKPLADEMNKVSMGFSALPIRIQKLITATEEYNNTVQNAATHTDTWADSTGNLFKKLNITYLLKKSKEALGKWINSANEYIETMNMFSVAMGEYGQAAYEYAQKVSDVMGIDPNTWMQNEGVFNSIITGFGVAGDRAALMSENLVQLGYDLASFYNIGTDEAMQKVQSGISGELEPLNLAA